MLWENKHAEAGEHLISEEIKKNLKTKIIGSKIITYEGTTSTMDIAKELVGKGIRNGTTVFSEEQTQGRGRSDHRWYCTKHKGLLFTIILKHNISPDYLCLLTGTIAVSIVETLQEFLNIPAQIKWPNDILIDGKKLGGVLVTLEKGLDKQPVFLIGIGLNINNNKDELPQQTHLPATSLAIEKKDHINRIQLARALLQNIDKWYFILKDEHFKYITEKWKEYCITIGKILTLKDGSQEYTGKVIDISYNGGLMLRLKDNQIKIFRSEHITIA